MTVNKFRWIALDSEEERTLREASERGPKYEFRMRCRCMLMSHQRHSISEIADYFEVSRHTIYNWFKAWEQWGLGGLYRQPGQGRKGDWSFLDRYKL